MLSAFELAPMALVWFGVLSFFAAFVQGTIGFGYAICSVPILALIDARLAPAPQLIQMVPLIFAIYWRERKHADWKGVLWTTVGRFPGTYLGMLLLGVASQSVLDMVIGASVLIAVILLRGKRAIPRSKGTELVAGVFSGAGSVVSAIGGPPIALLYKDAKGPAVRATLSVIFLVGLFVTIAGRAWAGKLGAIDLSLGALSIPIVGAGFALSRYTTRIVEGRRLQIAILGVSTLAALALIAQSLWSWAGF